MKKITILILLVTLTATLYPMESHKNQSERKLIDAIEANNTGLVSHLLSQRVNANAVIENTTPLMEAVFVGNSTIVALLLRFGANPNMPNNAGETALMVAATSGKAAIVQILLHEGAQLDLQDNNGYTALMNAAREGHTEIVLLLLEAGANADLKNKQGQTAVQLASEKDIQTILINYLKSRPSLVDRSIGVVAKQVKKDSSLLQKLPADLQERVQEYLHQESPAPTGKE